jgi:hypothetical protein
MIKTILAWITGKSDTDAKSSHPLDGATRTAQERAEAPYKVEAPAAPKVEEAPVSVEAVVPAPTVEVAPVTVKAKYKRADLNKMTKAQLMELVAKHGVEVKARATKEEIVKVLVKV